MFDPFNAPMPALDQPWQYVAAPPTEEDRVCVLAEELLKILVESAGEIRAHMSGDAMQAAENLAAAQYRYRERRAEAAQVIINGLEKQTNG